jgi:hypothetical protein
MRQAPSFFTQSRYYSPAFNAAIFDGPLRIYFAQYQESLALKIYFSVQTELQDKYAKLRDLFRRSGLQIYVMMYPSNDSFQLSFEQSAAANEVTLGKLGMDYVIGACGPLDENVCSNIVQRIDLLTTDLINLDATRVTTEVLAI